MSAADHSHRYYNQYTEGIIKSTGSPKVFNCYIETLTGGGFPQVINPHEHRYYLGNIEAIVKSSPKIKAGSQYIEVLWRDETTPPRRVFQNHLEVAYGEGHPQVIEPHHHRYYSPSVEAISKSLPHLKTYQATMEVMSRNFPVDPVTTINFIY